MFGDQGEKKDQGYSPWSRLLRKACSGLLEKAEGLTAAFLHVELAIFILPALAELTVQKIRKITVKGVHVG